MSSPFETVSIESTASGLFFIGADSRYDEALWKTDGTAAGTALVRGMGEDTSGGGVYGLVGVGSRVYFAGCYSGLGAEPWVSDGTPEGTYLLGDIVVDDDPFGWWPAHGSAPSEFVEAGGLVYFVASDEGNYRDLWAADPLVPESAFRVTQLAREPGSFVHSSVSQPTPLASNVLFSAPAIGTGLELHTTLDQGTRVEVVKDFTPWDYHPSEPRALTPYRDGVAFAVNAQWGTEVHTTRGTADTTQLVASHDFYLVEDLTEST